jgi:myosin-5
LDTWDSFFYLNRGETGEINGVDDAKEFVQTQQALSVIGISVSSQW